MALTELKVYRWSSYLVPGASASVLLAAAFAPWSKLKDIPNGIQSFSDAVLAVAAATVLCYVLGSLLWGAGYALKGRFLAVFLLKPGTVRPTRDLFSSSRHEHHRWTSAREALKQMRLANDFATELTTAIGTPARFRVQLLYSMEKLPVAIGPRLSAQWEYLSMLQTLALVWLLAVIALFVGRVVTFVSPLEAVGAIPIATGWRTSIGVLAALFIATGVTYRFRNRGLGRDLAASLVILAETDHIPLAGQATDDPSTSVTGAEG
jgi:hypothetical protein